MSFPDCTIHDVEQRTEEWFQLRRGRLTGSQMGSWLAEAPKVRLTIAEMKTELAGQGILFDKSAKKDDLIELLPNPGEFLTLTEATKSARKTAICKILGDLSGCPQKPDFEVDPTGPPPRSASAFPIWRGMVLEPYAQEEFEERKGLKVEEIGFCSWNDGKISVSPDGRILGTNTGWETKAPDPHTHSRYLLDGKLPEKYEPQVHGSMAATGADSWYFMSYCPRWRWREDLKEIEILSGGMPPLIIEVKRSELTERYLDGFSSFQVDFEEKLRRMALLCTKPDFKKLSETESLV